MSTKKILLIEDNQGDARLIQEALREVNADIKLNIVTNGADALNYLQQSYTFANADFPDLILLDLNVPKKNGKQLLLEIKSHEKLKKIPVIVLTISRSEADIVQCYEMHANAYIVKPFEIDKFFILFKSLIDFWFNVSVLPSSVQGDEKERSFK